MAIDKKLIDQLLTDYKRPEDIIGGETVCSDHRWVVEEALLQTPRVACLRVIMDSATRMQ